MLTREGESLGWVDTGRFAQELSKEACMHAEATLCRRQRNVRTHGYVGAGRSLLPQSQESRAPARAATRRNSMLQRSNAGVAPAPSKPSSHDTLAAAIQRANDYARISVVPPSARSLAHLELTCGAHKKPAVKRPHLDFSDMAAAMLPENADDQNTPRELIQWSTEIRELVEMGARVHAAQVAMAHARKKAAALTDDIFVKADELFRYDPEGRFACRELLLGMAHGAARISEAQAHLEGEMAEFIAMRTRICEPWNCSMRWWSTAGGQVLEDEILRLQRVSESLSRDLCEAMGRSHLEAETNEAERRQLVDELGAMKLEIEVVRSCLTPEYAIIEAKWKEEVEALEARKDAQRMAHERELEKRKQRSQVLDDEVLQLQLLFESSKRDLRRLHDDAGSCEVERQRLVDELGRMKLIVQSAKREIEVVRSCLTPEYAIIEAEWKEEVEALEARKDAQRMAHERELERELKEAKRAHAAEAAAIRITYEAEAKAQDEALRQECADQFQRRLEAKEGECIAIRNEMTRLQSLHAKCLAQGSLEALRRTRIGFSPPPESALLGKARNLILEEALKQPAAHNGQPTPETLSWRGTAHDYEQPGNEFHLMEWERLEPLYAARPKASFRKPPPLSKHLLAYEDAKPMQGCQPEPPHEPPKPWPPNQPRSPACARPHRRAPPSGSRGHHKNA